MSNAPDQRIWNEGCDPRGTLAEPYLLDGRKLDLPNDLAGSASFRVAPGATTPAACARSPSMLKPLNRWTELHLVLSSDLAAASAPGGAV
jgi:hypothetical protein